MFSKNETKKYATYGIYTLFVIILIISGFILRQDNTNDTIELILAPNEYAYIVKPPEKHHNNSKQPLSNEQRLDKALTSSVAPLLDKKQSHNSEKTQVIKVNKSNEDTLHIVKFEKKEILPVARYHYKIDAFCEGEFAIKYKLNPLHRRFIETYSAILADQTNFNDEQQHQGMVFRIQFDNLAIKDVLLTQLSNINNRVINNMSKSELSTGVVSSERLTHSIGEVIKEQLKYEEMPYLTLENIEHKTGCKAGRRIV